MKQTSKSFWRLESSQWKGAIQSPKARSYAGIEKGLSELGVYKDHE